jgi:dTDP-4-amino-4,6-dideoxygalactose transaminase
MSKIPFNKPFMTGKELDYIKEAVDRGHISGDGIFTKKCHAFFEETWGFKKTLLTTSCTAALEMAAILSNIGPDDEVIIPSFTFPSTATAFALRGATIIFADSQKDHPNLDVDSLSPLITAKTKAIIPVHYGGVPCAMEQIMEIAEKHSLFVIEDAAQAIDSTYQGKPLGSIGHFGAFSFHETKNISSGEGGLLAINDATYINRAEVIREKGTNRSAFFRGEIDKYGWVDIGSSFLPSDMTAAFLYAQLENINTIQKKRKALWNRYYQALTPLQEQGLLTLPPYSKENNGHVFYLLLPSLGERSALIAHLADQEIKAVFHYQSLHKSPYYHSRHDGRALPHADYFSDCLLRLPLYASLELEDVDKITEMIGNFFHALPAR